MYAITPAATGNEKFLETMELDHDLNGESQAERTNALLKKRIWMERHICEVR